jgi:hypothetical protein
VWLTSTLLASFLPMSRDNRSPRIRSDFDDPAAESIQTRQTVSAIPTSTTDTLALSKEEEPCKQKADHVASAANWIVSPISLIVGERIAVNLAQPFLWSAPLRWAWGASTRSSFRCHYSRNQHANVPTVGHRDQISSSGMVNREWNWTTSISRTTDLVSLRSGDSIQRP